MPAAKAPARTPSLISQLALVHACIGLIALIIGGIVLHHAIANVISEQHQLGLIASGGEVLQRLSRDGREGLTGKLSPEASRRFNDATGSMRYVVMDPRGEVLATSPGAAPALPRRQDGELPESFQEGQDGSRLWGVTRRVMTPHGPVDVQIAEDMDRSYVVLDDVAPAALGPILAVLALGAALLFCASALLLTVMLKPLRRAAEQAAGIGQQGRTRIDVRDMPAEVLPLIRALNGGLDRLDDALAWQRGFSAEVAHELRTPLAIMQAELDLLPASEAQERLRRDVQDLSKLVTDLLEAAEMAGDQPVGDAAFDLAEVATETGQRIDRLAEAEGRRVVPPRRSAEIWVRGNRDALGRALRNLIENALAHSPPGTAVEMSLRGDADAPEAAVAVADRGPGVPPAEREDIFRRHWRAGDTHRRGLGLGLSIAERIVRGHGGRIEVADNPAGGAVFTIVLPVLRQAAAAE
jgi:signal transduction histidine kinase